MSNEDASSPFIEAHRLLARATMLLHLKKRYRPPSPPTAPETAWATAFFFTDTLAMTAAHNLLLHHSGTIVRAIYKERFVTLEWLPAWSDAAADVAVLRLKQRPDDIKIDSVRAAYLDPALPKTERGRLWAGRTVVIYGYALNGPSPEERRIDGIVDTELPIVDTFFNLGDDPGPREPVPVQRLRIKGTRIREPRGMSGAAVFDLESGCAVAVQGSYVPDDPADPEPGDSRATEVARLIEHVPTLRQYCVPLDLARGSYRTRDNLPADLTRFVGREREIAQVRALLKRYRTVTLTGPGGVGKTRLAIAASRKLVTTTPDGVWLVELGPLADSDLVVQTVAAGLRVAPQPGRPLLTTLIDALRRSHLLLVLDNCEHLVEACARLTETIVRACPHVRVLATSRERLRCAGEVVWRVPSFGLPPPDEIAILPVAELRRFEAVGLFVARAEAARPGFILTAANARTVAEVCRRLDGIPLAIELAAAPMRGLSVEQIAARLDDRFRLLTGGNRTSLRRQQTLRETVEWSYALLSRSEQQLFDRLSVFAGSFTLEAVEAVCADDPDPASTDTGKFGRTSTSIEPAGGGQSTLSSQKRSVTPDHLLELLLGLVDKSLVQDENGVDLPGSDKVGEGRYRILETLREYGRQRLARDADRDRVRRRHLHYYLRLLERVTLDLDTSAQEVALRRLDAEQENLWLALRWACDQGDAEADHRLANVLKRLAEQLAKPAVRRTLSRLAFELRRLRLSAYKALETCLVDCGDTRTLVAGADLFQVVGDRRAEFALVHRLLQVEPDEVPRAFAQVRYAWLLLIQNEVRRATEILVAVADWASAHGHEPLLLDVLLMQGYAHFKSGRCREGRRAYERGLALLERLRPQLPDEAYQTKKQIGLRGRGCVEHNADDNEACAVTHREALALARARGDSAEEAVALVNLADALWGCGLLGQALKIYREAQEAASAVSYTSQSAFALLGRGAVLWSAGQHAAAAAALEAGLDLADDLEDAWSRAYGLAYLSNVRASTGAMADARRMSNEAISLGRGLGAGYPECLALLSSLWQREVQEPGDPTHTADIEAAVAKARANGLDGLALQLAWVRLLHGTANLTVPDRVLSAELAGLVEVTRAHLLMKGAWELLGLQVIQALRKHRPADIAMSMVASIETLVDEVREARVATLDPKQRKVYRNTRRCWEVSAR